MTACLLLGYLLAGTLLRSTHPASKIMATGPIAGAHTPALAAPNAARSPDVILLAAERLRGAEPSQPARYTVYPDAPIRLQVLLPRAPAGPAYLPPLHAHGPGCQEPDRIDPLSRSGSPAHIGKPLPRGDPCSRRAPTRGLCCHCRLTRSGSTSALPGCLPLALVPSAAMAVPRTPRRPCRPGFVFQ